MSEATNNSEKRRSGFQTDTNKKKKSNFRLSTDSVTMAGKETTEIIKIF